MKKIKIGFVLFLMMLACKATNFKCEQNQQKEYFCTKQYIPVCGVVKNTFDQQQSYLTFSNKCEACNDEQIEFYAQGECGQFPQQTVFCHPDDHLNDVCTEEYRPVCGFGDNPSNYSKNLKGYTYSNKCFACIEEDISYYIPEACEDGQNEKIEMDEDEKIDYIFNLLN